MVCRIPAHLDKRTAPVAEVEHGVELMHRLFVYVDHIAKADVPARTLLRIVVADHREAFEAASLLTLECQVNAIG